MTDRRSHNLRSSSQKSISAFSESFSCSEFGAFDLDYDEEGCEAMAAEAEAEAQRRLRRAGAATIDAMFEEEEEEEEGNGGRGESEGSEGGLRDDPAFGGATRARGSPPRGGGGARPAARPGRRRNGSKRWEPPKIPEDDGRGGGREEERGGSGNGRAPVFSDEEEASLSSSFKRKESANSERSKMRRSDDEDASLSSSFKRKDGTNASLSSSFKRKESADSAHGNMRRSDGVNCEASVAGTVNCEASVAGTVGSNCITMDPKSSGIVLAPTPQSGAAIHINAPSVTINYIIEQKVAPPQSLQVAPAATIRAPDDDSFAAWSRAGSAMTKDSEGSEKSRGENSGRSNIGRGIGGDETGADGNPGRGIREDDRNIRRGIGGDFGRGANAPTPNDAAARRSVREDEAPNFVRENRDDRVPKFVAPEPAAPRGERDAAERHNFQHPDFPGLPNTDRPPHAGECDAVGGEGFRHPDFPGQLNTDRLPQAGEDFNASHRSTSTCRSWKGGLTSSTSSMTASVSTTHASEMSASTRSVAKTVKVARAPSSGPYDLSELLDNLWTPENGPGDDPGTRASVTSNNAPSILRESLRSRSSSSSEEDGAVHDAGVASFLSGACGGDKNEVSQKDMSALKQIAEGRIPPRRKASKSDSTSLSQIEMTRSLVDLHCGQNNSATESRSSSWAGYPECEDEGQVAGSCGERRDHTKIPRASSKEGKEGEDHSRTSRENSPNPPPQLTSDTRRATDVKRGQQRSTSGGKARSVTQSGGSDHHIAAEGGVDDQEDAAGEQHVTFSKAPPRNLRNLLATAASDRDLSVYTDDNDVDSVYNKQNSFGPQMGSIAEGADGCGSSVASSQPAYKLDPGVAAFAQSFVEQFSKQKDRNVQNALECLDASITSSREDGSDMSAIEEAEAADRRRAPPLNKRDGRRRKNEPKATRSQGGGKRHAHGGDNADRESGRPHPEGRSKSMMMPQGRNPYQSLLDGKEDLGGGKSTSYDNRRPRPKGRSRRHSTDELCSSQVTAPISNVSNPKPYNEKEDVRERKSKSMSDHRRVPRSRSRRHIADDPRRDGRAAGSGSSTASNSKYSLGDLLRDDGDVVRDDAVEELLRLKEFDKCMVRRAGGKWSCSLVTDVGEDEMRFVVDKEGKKKRIAGRGSLLHNVRRLRK